MNSNLRIVLASGSPRRREILARLGYKFEIRVSDVREDDARGSVRDIVTELAKRKAHAVAASERDAVVIGADTLVALDGHALGKPADTGDAVRILTLLSGRAHEVLSGICLINTQTNTCLCDCVCTKVYFRNLSTEEILSYARTGEPHDKAGAYAIQGGAGAFVEKYEGSYDNIVGFPSERFSELINLI